jgi:hypothetical protein
MDQAEEGEADRTCLQWLAVALEVVELHTQAAVQTGIHQSHAPQGWLHTVVAQVLGALPPARHHKVQQQQKLQDPAVQQTHQGQDLD